jgi:hypothetical protein
MVASNPAGNLLAQPFQTSAVFLPDERVPSLGTGSEQLFLAAGRLLPVRLHLANQVMLI